jgi:murein endopeptidase
VLRALTGAAMAAALPAAPVHWHASTAVGEPWQGRLAHGVQLPAEGRHFFTWDPILKRSPDRPWRRWGTDRLVRLTLRVVSQYAAAHPDAPRLGIGDLSRPRGGDFGIRYGWPGHVSHQNGRDVDVYYPRRDRRELAPTRPAQIDRPLAQDLVDRFVRAGAVLVFVGPHTGLTGPRGVVSPLAHHDNHLHVRIGPVRSARDRDGRAAPRRDGLDRAQPAREAPGVHR